MDTTSTGEVSRVWVARLGKDEVDSVHRLRGLSGVSIAEHEGEIWIRGSTDEDGALPFELSAIRWARLQQLLDDDRLAPLDSNVPTEQLPKLDWRSIDTFSQPASIASALAPKLVAHCPIRLIHTPEFAEPSLLQTELAAFAAWVDHAPEIRLKPLRFACSGMREVLIQGEPVPSIPGQRFVLTADAIACPAGLTWDPPAPAASLIKLFGLNPGDLAILRRDGGSDIIPNANFVPVTRAAVRLTLANFDS